MSSFAAIRETTHVFHERAYIERQLGPMYRPKFGVEGFMAILNREIGKANQRIKARWIRVCDPTQATPGFQGFLDGLLRVEAED